MPKESCTDQTEMLKRLLLIRPSSGPVPYDSFSRKLLGEAAGTFIVMAIGFCVLLVNHMYSSSPDLNSMTPIERVTFSFFWRASVIFSTPVMFAVYFYTIGRGSGAHFNPAVTVTFAIFRGFPWNKVPYYVCAQLVGAVLASLLVRFFSMGHADDFFFGTVPTGSYGQSFVMEFAISFLLMFVTCGVTTGYKLLTLKAGLVVASTIMMNVLVAGPISGASMNPARTLGPAIVLGRYEGLWIYILGPFLGSFCGALAYKRMRFIDIYFA